uniref:Uncharacterized protein n=1 Tax=Dunaliella tertiolecta TaxID=3047 RepID=A0A7S3R8F9_DUNTE
MQLECLAMHWTSSLNGTMQARGRERNYETDAGIVPPSWACAALPFFVCLHCENASSLPALGLCCIRTFLLYACNLEIYLVCRPLACAANTFFSYACTVKMHLVRQPLACAAYTPSFCMLAT